MRVQLLYLQIIATSKETGLNIVADKSLEVQLSEPWVQKSLPAQEAGIARVANPEAVRDRVAGILTESSRLLLVLRLLVSLPMTVERFAALVEERIRLGYEYCRGVSVLFGISGKPQLLFVLRASALQSAKKAS